MKRLLLILFFLAIALTPGTSFAYSSNICQNTSGCTEIEVGPFMEGISQGCGNLGDCTLKDIMTVFVNVGNFVVGIIGAVVLMMYVVGGFYWLTSAGSSERVSTGKKYMSISTIGLLIVMFSYIGIITLKGVLETGEILNEDLQGYYACSGPETANLPCALNSTCVDDGYTCKSECQQTYPDATTDDTGSDGFTRIRYYECVNEKTFPDSEDEGNPYRYGSTCTSNLCPGSADVKCCQLEYYFIP